ncbi:hypothetical protein E4U21_004076 [Claviceps maximensis]|nr:hypothetical protein E4U21_004076 [Claviceps maximensis]
MGMGDAFTSCHPANVQRRRQPASPKLNVMATAIISTWLLSSLNRSCVVHVCCLRPSFARHCPGQLGWKLVGCIFSEMHIPVDRAEREAWYSVAVSMLNYTLDNKQVLLLVPFLTTFTRLSRLNVE